MTEFDRWMNYVSTEASVLILTLATESPDFIAGIKGAAFAMNDGFGGLAPDERLRLGVVLQEVVVDLVLKIIDAGVAAPPDALYGDLGEEALDEVQLVGAYLLLTKPRFLAAAGP